MCNIDSNELHPEIDFSLRSFGWPVLCFYTHLLGPNSLAGNFCRGKLARKSFQAKSTSAEQ